MNITNDGRTFRLLIFRLVISTFCHKNLRFTCLIFMENVEMLSQKFRSREVQVEVSKPKNLVEMYIRLIIEISFLLSMQDHKNLMGKQFA